MNTVEHLAAGGQMFSSELGIDQKGPKMRVNVGVHLFDM